MVPTAGPTMIGSLSYAFVLGLVATVNPCGFPMLPAYLSYFIGAEEAPLPLATRLGRAVGSGVAVAVGFAAVFAVLGGLLEAGLSVFMTWVPWVMVAMGAGIAGLGVLGLVTGHLTLRLPTYTRRRTDRSVWSKVGFGVSYALASLTCSLPVFLSGIAPAFTRLGVGTGVLTFLAYAAGMTAVLLVVSLAVAAARVSVVGVLRKSGRYVARTASAVLVAVGAYLIYYWISDLTGAAATGPVSAVESFEATLETLLSAHQVLLAVVAGGIAVVGVGWYLLARTGRTEAE